MKVLLIRTFPDRPDLSNVTYNYQEIGLAKAFNRTGIQCDVVYYDSAANSTLSIEYEPEKSFTVYYRKGYNLLKNGLFLGLSKLVDQYDWVHLAEYDQLQSVLMAWRFRRKMLIYHGPYYSVFNKRYNLKCRVIDPLLVPYYRMCKTQFVTKSELATTYLRQKGLKFVKTVGVGIDADVFADSKPSAISNKLSTMQKTYRILLYIGRIEPRRNILFLMDVFRVVKNKIPNTKLVIIGRGEETYVRRCFDYAKYLGIRDDIEYLESLPQAELQSVYKQCDVFLLPTLYDIFGMVLLEAMYCGLPVVSSVNGGSTTLLQNGLNGYKMLVMDANLWAEQVCKLLDDSAKANEIGRAAHETIVNHYTWDAMVVKFLDMYCLMQGGAKSLI